MSWFSRLQRSSILSSITALRFQQRHMMDGGFDGEWDGSHKQIFECDPMTVEILATFVVQAGMQYLQFLNLQCYIRSSGYHRI